MIKSNSIEKLNSKIERCDKYIEQEDNVSLRTEQKKYYTAKIQKIKHIRRVVSLWERSNHLWFNGSENDVYTFNDLLDYCNELHYNETVLDIICEGVYVPIGGSAIAPYDLREYLYLPSSLIEEDTDVKTIRNAFEDFGEDIVQL